MVTGITLPADILRKRAAGFSIAEDQIKNHVLITPERIVKQSFIGNEQGVLINGLFYLTDDARSAYNMRSRQVELGDDSFARQMYLGFQKIESTR